VPFAVAQKMRVTSIALSKGVEEPVEAALILTPSERVAVTYIAEAPVSMECDAR
jgi:flavin reductase (DIM6/NTAB) family NADH-FMN oxidoreductase RutF